MKLNIKKLGIEAEGDVEGIAKKVLDNHEKDWKEKYDLKHNAKKEIMELKHKYKLEEKQSESKKVDLLLKNLEKEQNTIKKSKNQSKNGIIIISIILFFIYGVFCIQGFKDYHIISAIISLIQMLSVLFSTFISMGAFKLFENDYKIFCMPHRV